MSFSHVEVTEIVYTNKIVSDGAFGVNFTFNYQSFGDKPWEKFDEIVADYQPGQIRFPAGSYTETVFNIEQPDAVQHIDHQGVVTNLTPMTEMLKFATAAGVDAVVVVPVAFALGEPDASGVRTFDPSAETKIYEYIFFLLDAAGANTVTRLEIGNEYAAYMNSVEYGRLASSFSEIIQEALDDYRNENNLPNNWVEPDIAIQIFSQSPNGGNSIEDLDSRNENVMSQFTNDGLDAVDAVVDHFYYFDGRNSGEENEHSIHNIYDAVSVTTDRITVWEEVTNRELTHVVSEWNTSHLSDNVTGLRQVPFVLEMLEAFILNDVEELDFWSSQYHATSICDAQGNLMIIGRLFTEYRDSIEGAQIVDMSTNSEDISIASFEKGNTLTLFASSLTESSQNLHLSSEFLMNNYVLVNVTRIEVDESTADGEYKSLSDLPYYLEPDVEYFINDLDLPPPDGITLPSILMNSYETVVLTFESVQIDFITLTDGEFSSQSSLSGGDYRLQKFDGNQEQYVGGEHIDVLSAENISFGGVFDLQYGSSYGFFESIEGLIGGSYADLIRGNENDNVLFGAKGDDVLNGRWGDDELYGGQGDDILQGGNGADYLSGGSGVDAAIYTSSMNGIGVDLEGRTANFGDAYGDVFVSIENLVGSSHNDILRGDGGENYLVGADGSDILEGRDGNDVLEGEGGNDQLFGGQGFDTVLAGAGNDTIWGGEGNDSVLASAGNDTIGGSVGNDTLDGGEGNDTIWGGGGNDNILGSAGNDVVGAGAGNDTLDAGSGDDTVWGGAGDDTILASTGNDEIGGGRGDDVLYGGAGENLVFGGADDDEIYSGAGNDTLYGGAGSDTLDAGAGDDLLYGGLGNDALTGGAGSDIFIYGDNFEEDAITDFTLGVDTLRLNDNLWTGLNTAGEIVTNYASINGNGVSFDFGDGDILTLSGLTSLNGLEDHIEIF
ncbi:MAG: calcium-binding protein [Litorimonas sp.]